MRRLMRLHRNTALGVLLLGGLASLTACGVQPIASVSGLRVVTSTTIFADVVGQVGGSRLSVVSIVPPGVGPEDYEPRTGDSRRIADAQLIVSNGVGLDAFFDDLITAAAPTTPRLILGDGIPSIEVDGEANPHFWLDPTLVVAHYLPAISAKLGELDPGGRPAFEQNAAAYRLRIEELDAALKLKVAEVPATNRKLVTFHDAFPYFARHFGFELVGVIVENVGQDPSAGELADLVNRVKAAGVKAVFSEAQFSPKLAQTLADEAGVRKVVTTLYNDALGDPPADTYLGMMRWNVEQVVEVLK